MTFNCKRVCLTALWLLAWTTGASAEVPFYAPVMLVAGDGLPGYKDGDFSQAEFNGLGGLLLDEEQGILYAAETGNGAIRMIHLNAANRVSTLVGKRGPGLQDGALAEARLKEPQQLVWGEKGKTIFFCDAGNHQIKRLDLKTATLTTVGGTSEPGYKDGPRTAARFDHPQGLCYLHTCRKLVVADTGNRALRLVDAETGETQTLFKPTLLDKPEFQFCFLDTKGDLVATSKNKPGFWKFLKKSKTPLNLTDLAPSPANAEGGELKSELCRGTDAEITAITPADPFLYYSLKQPEFGRSQSPLHVTNLYQLKEPDEIINYQAWQPQPAAEGHPGAETKTAGPVQAFRLYDQANGLAYSPQEQRIFVADETNHRILSIRPYRPGEFYRGSYYPPKKAPGVKRVLLFGNSMSYYLADRPVESDRNLELSDSLSKRIEYWLNTLSVAKGAPSRYEVIYAGGAMFYSAPSVAYAFYNFFAVDKFQADLVLYNYTYFDMIFDAMRYLQTPSVNGELQHHDFDPEFFLTDLKKRPLHPLGRELLDYIIKHPEKVGNFVKYYPRDISTNDWNTLDILYDEDNRNIFFRLAVDELDKYQKQLNAYAAKSGRRVPLVLNLIPLPANLYNNDILSGYRQGLKTKPNFLKPRFQTWCREKGIGFQDTIDPVRMLDVSLFPLFLAKDNYHYTAKSADVVAFFTASQLLEKLESREPGPRASSQP
ncbi:MAG: hypothetical protein HGA76_03030 [Candidatus Firestonebacteria bacterium]|nr:hypothetical protein [Candidatus Firestonebacteria bacterium]